MCYHDAFATMNEMTCWADSSPLVNHWRSDTPGCLYLLSEHTAVELSKDFRLSGRVGPFLITEVSGDLAGTMLPETWVMLKDKRPSRLHSEPLDGELRKSAPAVS